MFLFHEPILLGSQKKNVNNSIHKGNAKHRQVYMLLVQNSESFLKRRTSFIKLILPTTIVAKVMNQGSRGLSLRLSSVDDVRSEKLYAKKFLRYTLK